jgi:hypothetical protein
MLFHLSLVNRKCPFRPLLSFTASKSIRYRQRKLRIVAYHRLSTALRAGLSSLHRADKPQRSNFKFTDWLPFATLPSRQGTLIHADTRR